MKTGMNLLLWTTHVTEEHFPLMAKLKKAGFDGVEMPLFEGDAAHYKKIAQGTEQPRPGLHDRHGVQPRGQPDQPRRRPSARRASTASSGPSR